MKYYKDDILNKYSAKFKDSEFENKFHEDLYTKNSSEMIFRVGYDLYKTTTSIAAILFMLLIKFVPRKYSQYIIMATQVYTTYSICYLHSIISDRNYEIYYLNGIAQVMYWIVECQNFIAETISMMLNFGVILYFQQISYSYSINYFLAIFIVCVYKYSHNLNERRLYLALKNFQEWEGISEQIIPNLFIVQSFDYRTNKMQVYDCNNRAKQFDIHQSQEKYISFLNQLQIEDFLSITKTNNDSDLKTQYSGYTLKDYLLKKHEEIYRVFIESDKNKQKKFKSMKVKNIRANSSPQNAQNKSYTNDQSQESIESLNVTMVNNKSQKNIQFKVKIFSLYMNEPYLVLSLEDISLYSKIKFLKEKQNIQDDLVQELIECLKDKVQTIEQLKQTSVRFIQRQIIHFKLILKSFQSTLRPLKIRPFQFSEVIEQLKQIYSDFPIVIKGEYSNIQINSDQAYIFTTIMYIISSLKIENINFFEVKQIKDKLCEKVILTITAKYVDQVNLLTQSFNNYFEIYNYAKINSICGTFLQSVMKLICLKDKPSFSQINDQEIRVEMEYLLDVTQLNQSNQNYEKLILSPNAFTKRFVAFSSQSLAKSYPNNNLSINNSILKPTNRSNYLCKTKEVSKEFENDQSNEDNFQLDSVQSSHIRMKISNNEYPDLMKFQPQMANLVYDFSQFRTMTNIQTSNNLQS